MTRFTITHEFSADEATFWKTFLDRDYNEALFRKALGFPQFDILRQDDDDKTTRRSVRAQPRLDVPGTVAKILGPGFGYTEEGTFDKAARTWRWKMTPSVLADKMVNEGTLRVQDLGQGRCRRTAEVVIEVKMFGVGGMLEATAEKQLRAGWEESARFMERWFKEHKQ